MAHGAPNKTRLIDVRMSIADAQGLRHQAYALRLRFLRVAQVRIGSMAGSSAASEVTAVATIPKLVALTDTAGLRAAGITYPGTLHAWRWLYRHRHERGVADAFRRIGRRIVVDPERYVELVRQRAES